MKLYKYNENTLTYKEYDFVSLVLNMIMWFTIAFGILSFCVLYPKKKNTEKQESKIIMVHPKTDKDTIVSDTLKYKVHATFYNATVSQCDGIPNKTASGFNIDMSAPYKHRIIAISRDLLAAGFNLGDKVFIKFPHKHSLSIYNGQWRIEDKTGRAHKKLVDLLVDVDMPMGSVQGVEIIKILKN